MLGSTLALAMGVTLLVAVRVDGNAAALGVVVFVGLVLVAIACAMHLSALVARSGLGRLARFAAQVAVWLVVAAGTAWAVARAPGDETLVALMVVPSGVGMIGVLASRSDRWAATAFLVLGLMLSAALVQVWLERS